MARGVLGRILCQLAKLSVCCQEMGQHFQLMPGEAGEAGAQEGMNVFGYGDLTLNFLIKKRAIFFELCDVVF